MICIDVSKVKEIIGIGYFSITTDYWTSLCKDNYGEITHLISLTIFLKLWSLVVSFEKHVGGCSEEELQEQLYNSLTQSMLKFDKLCCIVFDSVCNMNHFSSLVYLMISLNCSALLF
jgi:hypothetical protein